MLQVNGLQDDDLGKELSASKQADTAGLMGRPEFENGSSVRRAVWSPKGRLGKDYPVLSNPMRRLLSLHATSAAPERNWSQWGNMYRKNRSSLSLTRAEKLVAVSSAAKIRYKEFRSADERELELMCTAIDENTFGNALVGCVLMDNI